MNERICDDNCIYLSCNERFQNVHYNINKERPPHMCNKYKKRLYHLEYHPNICKCEECMKEQYDTRCKYCQHENNDFVLLNETADYSGIEMALNRQGVLRVRYYDDSQIWFSEDIINIKFCPMCGRKIL